MTMATGIEFLVLRGRLTALTATGLLATAFSPMALSATSSGLSGYRNLCLFRAVSGRHCDPAVWHPRSAEVQ